MQDAEQNASTAKAVNETREERLEMFCAIRTRMDNLERDMALQCSKNGRAVFITNYDKLNEYVIKEVVCAYRYKAARITRAI